MSYQGGVANFGPTAAQANGMNRPKQHHMLLTAAVVYASCLAPLLAGAATLDLYRQMTGKTLLVAPALPQIRDLAGSGVPADKTNAITTIEEALAKSGIAVVSDGPHFIRILSNSHREELLKAAPLRGQEISASAGGEILPRGMVDLQGMDLTTVLGLYADLSRQTVLRPLMLPESPITLKTECALSRNEVVYALKTVIALNDIAMLEDGSNFVQVVPKAGQALVKTQAPQREPNAKLFDPGKLPNMGSQYPPAPTPKRVDPKKFQVSGSQSPAALALQLENDFRRMQAAFLEFISSKGPAPRPAFRLLDLYAVLTDKKALPSEALDELSILFRIQTPLSKNELLYAIETTLELNNLTIVPVGDHTVRLGRLGELRNR